METLETKVGYEAGLQDYVDREKAAVDLMNSVGRLMYDRGVELVFFRNHLLDISISESSNISTTPNKWSRNLSMSTQRPMLPVDFLTWTSLRARSISVVLTHEFKASKSTSVSEFLTTHLSAFIGQDKHTFKPQDVVLYGFGRIGRIAARELVKQAGKGQQLRLRAIVTRTLTDEEIVKRAALLRNDSVHGAFKGTVIEDVPNKIISINGQQVQLIAASNPEDIDYTIYGIHNALVIDNTGAFTKRADLERHLMSKGVSKVLLTAPGKEVPQHRLWDQPQGC